jgi:hypothetical protein
MIVVAGDHSLRLEMIREWKALPDCVSVNFSEEGYGPLCELLRARGVGIEAGLARTEDAQRFIASRIACVRALIEVEGDRASALDLANDIDRILDDAGIRIPRLYHGYGDATWDVISTALARCCDVRSDSRIRFICQMDAWPTTMRTLLRRGPTRKNVQDLKREISYISPQTWRQQMIEFTVNGKPARFDDDPSTPLLWVLRDSLGLTGTKFGYGIARCGACSVHLNGEPVRACVTPVYFENIARWLAP